MAFNRGYGQPSPWSSGAPPGQVMSGLMTATGYPQGFGNPTGYNQLGAASGINWNMPNNVGNGQLRMGQQAGWGQQGIIQTGGNQRINQRTPNKRNGNWNDGGHQIKRQNKGPNTPNRNQLGNNKGNQNRNNNNNSNRNGNNTNNNNRNSFGNNNRNNQQKNRKQNQNHRGKAHHNAQRTAQNLTKKEYPIKKATNTDANNKTKNEDFDSSQGTYVVPVFGFCCKLCDVFLKDKLARNEHAKLEEHLEKFKVAEEEKKAKKLAKVNAKKDGEEKEKTEQTNGDSNETEEVEEQNGEEENDAENENENEEDNEDANTTENGNEDQEELENEDAQVDSSEVTEESKNLQQSIQQDLNTEQQTQKKVNTPKNKNFNNKPNNRGAKGARANNRGGRGGRGGKKN